MVQQTTTKENRMIVNEGDVDFSKKKKKDHNIELCETGYNIQLPKGSKS